MRNSILATVVYYDIFEYPLTLLEVYKFLVNPTRVHKLAGGLGEISIGDVSGELDRLVNSKILGEKDGFYFLKGRDELYPLRMERYKLADRKWKKFLKQIKYLSLAPYLEGVFASGSMAINNTTEESDFDVLIISKPGRLYTCRLFLWLISSMIGSRRKRDQKIAPDKLCFNHYLTDGNLKMVHQSIFNAQTYINLKPVMIAPEMVERFFAANFWLNDYAYNFKIQKDFSRRSVKAPVIFRSVARISESLLSSYPGNILENFLKRFQQKRIRINPATYEPGGRVVFNERELEFHPRSFEKAVIERYNHGLERLGIRPYLREVDSGLTR